MSVSAVNVTMPDATYGSRRVRATPARVRAAAPAPIAGAISQDGKYIPYRAVS